MRKFNHIGILSITAEAAAHCFRLIFIMKRRHYPEKIAPEVTLYSPGIFPQQRQFLINREWEKVSYYINSAIDKLAEMGAAVVIIPANSIYFAIDKIIKGSPIPVLNLIELVIQEIQKKGFKKIGILGTKFTLENELYQKRFQLHYYDWQIPRPEDREQLEQIIQNELIVGRKPDKKSIDFIKKIIQQFKESNCDGVLLACTELPIIIDEFNSSLPVIDSNALLAKSALDFIYREQK